jgi:urate oxidase
MTASMGPNRYGKDGIRLVLVRRGRSGDGLDELRDLTVDVRLEGDFDAVHTEGDNTPVLATDTMRSTVYALAQEHLTGSIEDFGAALARRYLHAAPAAEVAEVSLREHAWARTEVGGTPHPHAFAAGPPASSTAVVTAHRDGALGVRSGIAGLTVLKTTDSAFSGFLRDEFTVLAETEDRILATEVTADWDYLDGSAPAYDDIRATARQTLLESFATHDSKSVQHTLYAMGEALLAASTDMREVSMRMPNKHHIAVDLSPFGIENDRAVFVATDRPFGVIEGTVTRG